MRTSFALVLAYLAIVRALEVAHSRRNTAALLRRGAVRVVPDGFRGLAAVHVLWFAGLLLEETLVGPTLSPGPLRSTFVGVALASEAVRLAAIASLRERWSMHVITLPGVAAVRTGLFRACKHPNYVAICVQLVALPLALGLPWTPVFVLPLKLVAVRYRMRIEDEALCSATEALTP